MTHKHGFEAQLIQKEELYFMRAEMISTSRTNPDSERHRSRTTGHGSTNGHEQYRHVGTHDADTYRGDMRKCRLLDYLVLEQPGLPRSTPHTVLAIPVHA